ncbi:MAG: transcriptional regulator [Candidatus Absconditicoccaceae bacterium]|nr:MAG: helix-turn-helix domain-containing protein [Candidatus Gracilibacteria bacterium]
MIEHPGKLLEKFLKEQGRKQKTFALHIGKRVSEINELIKGKRNITISRDILISRALRTPEKFWILKQVDYDYQEALKTFPNLSLESNNDHGFSGVSYEVAMLDKNKVQEDVHFSVEDKKKSEDKDQSSLMTQIFQSF